MARTRYVHRTILSTEAEVKVMNLDTDEIKSVVVSVQGKYDDPKKLEKEVRKAYEAMNLPESFVGIKESHVATKEYRMLESQFMAFAEATEVDPNAESESDDEDGEEYEEV